MRRRTAPGHAYLILLIKNFETDFSPPIDANGDIKLQRDRDRCELNCVIVCIFFFITLRACKIKRERKKQKKKKIVRQRDVGLREECTCMHTRAHNLVNTQKCLLHVLVGLVDLHSDAEPRSYSTRRRGRQRLVFIIDQTKDDEKREQRERETRGVRSVFI